MKWGPTKRMQSIHAILPVKFPRIANLHYIYMRTPILMERNTLQEQEATIIHHFNQSPLISNHPIVLFLLSTIFTTSNLIRYSNMM